MKRKIAAGFIATLALGFMGGTMAHSSTVVYSHYSKVSGPSGAIGNVWVRGAGCLTTEDSTTLKLTSWEPGNNRVYYTCVTP